MRSGSLRRNRSTSRRNLLRPFESPGCRGPQIRLPNPWMHVPSGANRRCCRPRFITSGNFVLPSHLGETALESKGGYFFARILSLPPGLWHNKADNRAIKTLCQRRGQFSRCCSSCGTDCLPTSVAQSARSMNRRGASLPANESSSEPLTATGAKQSTVLDRFEEVWQCGERPDIADFLPEDAAVRGDVCAISSILIWNGV